MGRNLTKRLSTSQVSTMDGNHDETCWTDPSRSCEYYGSSWSISDSRLKLTRAARGRISCPELGQRLVKCTFQLGDNRFSGNCRKGPPKVGHLVFLSPSFILELLASGWPNLPILLFQFTSPFLLPLPSSLAPLTPQPWATKLA